MAPAKVDSEKSATIPQEDGPPDYSVQAPAEQLPPDLSERLANLRLNNLGGVCTDSCNDAGSGLQRLNTR
jgi:hypothetical protein